MDLQKKRCVGSEDQNQMGLSKLPDDATSGQLLTFASTVKKYFGLYNISKISFLK